VFSLVEMDNIVRRLVIDRFDHKHLNQDTEEFKQRNPTVENIASVIFGILQDHFRPAHLAGVRLFETPKTWVDVMASSAAE
jgi:6-pyruvoyltetrahydropterin/6-carboxytetrahydropterin synthase